MEHREHSQYFIVTINRVQPLKILWKYIWRKKQAFKWKKKSLYGTFRCLLPVWRASELFLPNSKQKRGSLLPEKVEPDQLFCQAPSTANGSDKVPYRNGRLSENLHTVWWGFWALFLSLELPITGWKLEDFSWGKQGGPREDIYRCCLQKKVCKGRESFSPKEGQGCSGIPHF